MYPIGTNENLDELNKLRKEYLSKYDMHKKIFEEYRTKIERLDSLITLSAQLFNSKYDVDRINEDLIIQETLERR